MDWKKGDVQVGLFIRFGDGRIIETTVNSATEPIAAEAVARG